MTPEYTRLLAGRIHSTRKRSGGRRDNDGLPASTSARISNAGSVQVKYADGTQHVLPIHGLSQLNKAVDEASSVMQKLQTSVGLLGGVVSQLSGGLAQVRTVMQGFVDGGPAGAVIATAGELAKGIQEVSRKNGGVHRIG